jgi:putative membrane protein insertion efficiency factor
VSRSAPAGADRTPRLGPVAWVLSLPIRAWRLVSRHLPPRCRFHPSCSAYALEALELHGAARGSWLAVRRVGRCHPWHEGGFDPVPVPNIRSQRRLSSARPVKAPHV